MRWLACGDPSECRVISHVVPTATKRGTGVQLEGDPGNGKTSYIVNLGRLLGCSVSIIDLGSCRRNEDLDRLIARGTTGMNEIKIFAYEDLDGVYDGRVNRTATDHETGVTFDHFLNTIDGAKSNNGVITIITTNHPERLDPALTRHGRIDYRVKVGPPTEEAKRIIASRILDFSAELAEKVITESEACEVRESGAAFEHRCLRTAENWLKENAHLIPKSASPARTESRQAGVAIMPFKILPPAR